MSADKSKRRYRSYSWVALDTPIRCPKRNTSQADFSGTHFAFFHEDGMLCIQVRDKPALVTEVHPSHVKEARRDEESAES